MVFHVRASLGLKSRIVWLVHRPLQPFKLRDTKTFIYWCHHLAAITRKTVPASKLRNYHSSDHSVAAPLQHGPANTMKSSYVPLTVKHWNVECLLLYDARSEACKRPPLYSIPQWNYPSVQAWDTLRQKWLSFANRAQLVCRAADRWVG